MNNFFNNVSDLETLKRTYKELAKVMHPDMGGNTEDMQALNNEYAKAYKNLKNRPEGSAQTLDEDGSVDLSDAYANAIASIIDCEGLEILLIGNWIWIGGNTFPYRDQLKAAGFLWASKKKQWFFRTEEHKSNAKREFTMQEIMEKYKVQNINKSNHQTKKLK